jgi:hypothetical protein
MGFSWDERAGNSRGALIIGLALLLLPLTLRAQAATRAKGQSGRGSVSGEVLDPSGAAVAGATVSIAPAQGGAARVATTDKGGAFHFGDLPAGDYRLTAGAANFAQTSQAAVEVRAGKSERVRLSLSLRTQQQSVTVSAQNVQVSVAPQENASAMVMHQDDLKALANDPDELLIQLQELAGPSVGPNGPTIYIDGFSGGDLPPKEAIQAVKVNSNPFDVEHAHLGYGRIEIITKPGYQKYHGGASVYANYSAWNSISPFLAGHPQPPYHTLLYNGQFGGPLGQKSSFFTDYQRRSINHDTLVNTTILNPTTLTPENYTAALTAPRLLTNWTLRLDHQMTPTNTLTARYNYFGISAQNQGVGGQSLPDQAYAASRRHHLIQLSDTQAIGASTLNQLMMQILHFNDTQSPNLQSPTLEVLGAFSGGGYTGGIENRSESHYQFENLTSFTTGRHQVEIGEAAREIVRGEAFYNNFNGTFIFNSLANYQETEKDLAAGETMAQIAAAGQGPSQFNLTAGNPYAYVRRLDGSAFGEDDWKLRPNLLLSYGLRFESENVMSDHADFAPRVGLAWGPNNKTVVRGGWGVFYDRLDDDQMIQAEHLNGVNELQYVIGNPVFFPTFPPPAKIAAQYSPTPTVYRIAPNMQAPYLSTAAASIERQVRRNFTASITYLNSRGERQFLSNDVNAPLPANGVRPFGEAAGNIYQYESLGIFRQNQAIANFNWRGDRMSLFGYYMWNSANSDTAGVDSFATDPYNLMADYGRARFDIRNRFFMGGSVSLPWGVQLYPMLLARSGIPFSITISNDVFGTGLHNARPAPATASTPPVDLRVTPYGNFNVAPSPTGPIIAPNTATGPSAYTFNLRLSKTMGFGSVAGHHEAVGPGEGPEHHWHPRGLGGRGLTGGGGPDDSSGSDHRYSVTATVAVRNLLNHPNFGVPVGNLDSPLFGQSIALTGDPYSSEGSADRRVDLGLSLSF